ncbi:MFS transporter [Acidisoma sp.]|uniref:MFS transporter n=1 Tax=Acidisoma sp. TaxID=1872115 RepID=UPI003B006D7D
MSGPASIVAPIERGTPAFRRTTLALGTAGFSTFALLYSIQPLLPVFSRQFHVTAAGASLSLSLTTGLMAVCMLMASTVSESVGRKPVMVVSVLASSVLMILSALVPQWWQFLVLRALMGVTLSGLPAVAMAYVAEEIDPRHTGLSMGLYIGGNALGGMSGRLLIGVLADHTGWRVALLVIGVASTVGNLIFWRILPPSRNFRSRSFSLETLTSAFVGHLRDSALLMLFAEGFLLMGGFVAIYNYLGYRLLAPPFDLNQAEVGLIFSAYLVGIFSSAWMGNLGNRLGRRHVLWVGFLIMLAGTALTETRSVILIILGVVVVTFGFFGAHSIASGWVSARARHAKAQASSLYLFFYYLGSSVVGTTGGVFMQHYGWTGVTLMTGTLILIGLFLSRRLSHIPPLATTGR